MVLANMQRYAAKISCNRSIKLADRSHQGNKFSQVSKKWLFISALAIFGFMGSSFTTSTASAAIFDDDTMYRLYNGRHHFYTASSSEKSWLVGQGWKLEGSYRYLVGALPVTRLYNPRTGDHIWTHKSIEINKLASTGWTREGVAFYSAGPVSTPLGVCMVTWLRLVAGDSHFYTPDPYEYRWLISLGWMSEGPAFTLYKRC
jgi:hypothetical protein